MFCSFLQIGCSRNNQRDSMMVLPELIPYRKGDLWGYCDKDKNMKIPCQYSYAELFDTFGLAKVYLPNTSVENYNNTAGLIDTNGNVVVPFIHDNNKFYYTIFPYDGKSQTKFGLYEAKKWKDYIIVINYPTLMCESELNKIPEVFINVNYSNKIEVYNRNGDNIFGDSIEVLTFYSDFRCNSIKYLVTRKDRKSKFRIRDIHGTALCDAIFDEIKPFNDSLFIGKKDEFGWAVYSLSGKFFFDNSGKELHGGGDYIRTANNIFSIKNRKYLFPRDINQTLLDFSTLGSMKLIGTADRLVFGSEKRLYSLFDMASDNLILDKIESYEHNKLFDCYLFFSKQNVWISKSDGNIFYKNNNVDTAFVIGKEKLLLKINGKCGIWSLTENRYIIEPIYVSINWTFPKFYILENDKKEFIISDAKGNIDSSEKYRDYQIKHFSNRLLGEKNLIVEESWIMISPNQKQNLSMQIVIHTYEQKTDSVSDLIYNPIYTETDYDEYLEKYIHLTTCLIAEKLNGEFFVINDDLKKAVYDKKNDLIFKFGDLFFLRASSNTKVENSAENQISCLSFSIPLKSMYNLTYINKNLLFYKGVQSIIVRAKEATERFKDGIINEKGELLFPFTQTQLVPLDMEYKDNTNFRYGLVRLQNSSTLIYSFNLEELCKVDGYYHVNYWGQEFGVVVNAKNRQGLVNNKGKIVIPVKYSELSFSKFNLISVYDDYQLLGYYSNTGIKYFE